jgi:hypothetical protein
VTFLFTDVEGSTAAWEQHPDAMRTALALHDELLRSTFSMRGDLSDRPPNRPFVPSKESDVHEEPI